MTQNVNPLKQFFRQPAIYLRLPSDGRHWPKNALNMPENKELPIFPMTAIDEITYRTPDAVFNGQAVVNVIQSCAPNIKDAWSIPGVDLNAILIGIRIASYGHNMEFETVCPHCAESSEFGLDLRTVLDQMRSPDYSRTIKQGDLEVFFKPMTYKNLNDNNHSQFEEQKILQMLPDAEIPDQQKITALSEAMKKLTDVTVNALVQSIAAVKTPDSMVTETAYIAEMLKNCDRRLFNQIRDHIISIKGEAEIKPLKLKCNSCNQEYEQAVTLDMSSFFEVAS